jgi:hypothetical protein
MAEPLTTQLQKIEEAIAKLQSGERIASVSYNGHAYGSTKYSQKS